MAAYFEDSPSGDGGSNPGNACADSRDWTECFRWVGSVDSCGVCQLGPGDGGPGGEPGPTPDPENPEI